MANNIAPKNELRAWMARTGRTQASLAAELGLSVGFVSLVINGHKRCSLELALRLAEMSDLPVALFAELRKARMTATAA